MNLKATFFTVQKLEPMIEKGGSIILTTTVLNHSLYLLLTTHYYNFRQHQKLISQVLVANLG